MLMQRRGILGWGFFCNQKVWNKWFMYNCNEIQEVVFNLKYGGIQDDLFLIEDIVDIYSVNAFVAILKFKEKT